MFSHIYEHFAGYHDVGRLGKPRSVENVHKTSGIVRFQVQISWIQLAWYVNHEFNFSVKDNSLNQFEARSRLPGRELKTRTGAREGRERVRRNSKGQHTGERFYPLFVVEFIFAMGGS